MHFNTPVYHFDLEALYQYINNPNAFIVLARRESVLNRPTHFCFYSDYQCSETMLRQGYKEALTPFVLSHLTEDVTKQAFIQADYDKAMEEWRKTIEENKAKAKALKEQTNEPST